MPVPLTINALAEHYEVSYTPVRTALEQLTAQGLVLKTPNGRLARVKPSKNGSAPKLDEAELPATVQALAPEARVDHLTEQGRKRKELDSEIRELTSKRDAYLSDQAASVADVEESLDYQMFEAVRSQAEAKGLVYEGKTPKL